MPVKLKEGEVSLTIDREKLAIILYEFDNPDTALGKRLGWGKCPEITRLMCRKTADAIIANQKVIFKVVK